MEMSSVKLKAKTVSKSSPLHLKSSYEFRHLLADWSNSDEFSSDDEMGSEERAQLTGALKETTTVCKAYFNLTVCVVASALLSIPFGFDKTGWLGGIPLLAGVGLLVDYTSLCLGETCMKLDVYDYQEICEISFGKFGRYIQAATQLSLSLSLMISYQIISADNLMGILRTDWVKNALISSIPLNTVLVLLLTTVVILPLSSFATLKMLGYSSMISIVSILILALSLVYFDITREPINTIDRFGGEVLTGLGVFATGFVCHQIITPTLQSLPGDNVIAKKGNYHKVVHLAISTSFIFFLLVGLTGYYLCHDAEGVRNCPGNILSWNNPDVGSIAGNCYGKIALGMFLITALVAYPLEHFSCYNTICRLLYGEWGQPSKLLGLTIKLMLVVSTTVPAIYLDNIGPLLAWAGNLAAFPLGFILPLSLALKNRSVGGQTSLFQTLFRSTLLVLSIVLMILQTFQNLSSFELL